jgi:hypothetical protein
MRVFFKGYYLIGPALCCVSGDITKQTSLFISFSLACGEESERIPPFPPLAPSSASSGQILRTEIFHGLDSKTRYYPNHAVARTCIQIVTSTFLNISVVLKGVGSMLPTGGGGFIRIQRYYRGTQGACG